MIKELQEFSKQWYAHAYCVYPLEASQRVILSKTVSSDILDLLFQTATM